MSYYVKRVEKVLAYPFNGHWPSFIEEVRPPKFQVEELDSEGNLSCRGNPRSRHEKTRLKLWLHGADGPLTISEHETLMRRDGTWSVVPTQDFNEEWEPTKIEPGFSR